MVANGKFRLLCSSKYLIFSLILIVNVLSQSCSNESDELCSERHQRHDPKGKYKANDPWKKYLLEIDKALAEYKECSNAGCTCHTAVIDSDLAPWKTSGISRHDFDWARSRAVHYQIIDHKLYRQRACMFPFRCSGIEHFILGIINDLPDMDLAINVQDWPQAPKYAHKLPVFSFSKVPSDHYDIMYPAWTFWEGGPAVWPIYPTGLGRWDKQRTIIPRAASDWPWEKKLMQAFFRGSRTTSERDPLVRFSRQNPDLVDAQYTKNQAWKSDEDTLYRPPAKEVPLEDHCRYKYLFNFRGIAASFRFKHLFLCDSAVFHVGEEWQEFFYPAMKSWVHYVPMRKDLSDLSEKLQFARENDDVISQIAQRGRRFIWEHLRMEDVQCYWRTLLLRYAELLQFSPELQDGHVQIKQKR